MVIIMQNQLDLISVCQEIGGIAESNGLYTSLLSQQFTQPIEEMTVAELLAIHRQYLETFNEVMK